jgi:hypothetical protein
MSYGTNLDELFHQMPLGAGCARQIGRCGLVAPYVRAPARRRGRRVSRQGLTNIVMCNRTLYLFVREVKKNEARKVPLPHSAAWHFKRQG